MRLLLLLALPLLLPACGAGRKARKLEGRYDTGAPGAGWSKVSPGGADYAWFNSDLAASIYADSNCASRFEDRALEALADSATYGMAIGKPDFQEVRRIDDRDALFRKQDGNLDGVPFRLGVAVLKKDQCIYDVMVVAPHDGFDRAWDGFEGVVAGFAARGR